MRYTIAEIIDPTAFTMRKRPGRPQFALERADQIIALLPASPPGAETAAGDTTGPDAALEPVDFYERELYPLSNFSAFTLQWKGIRFDTSEAAYHWEKFPRNMWLQYEIQTAPSAHEAFKLAERHRSSRHPRWDEIKVDIMRKIIRAKVEQHEYCRRKLLETGDRLLIEGSWRDDFWGIGPNKDGQNMLGKLWMELRSELRQAARAYATRTGLEGEG
jgi:ribA/ribD-fused uncharacterized protein